MICSLLRPARRPALNRCRLHVLTGTGLLVALPPMGGLFGGWRTHPWAWFPAPSRHSPLPGAVGMQDQGRTDDQINGKRLVLVSFLKGTPMKMEQFEVFFRQSNRLDVEGFAHILGGRPVQSLLRCFRNACRGVLNDLPTFLLGGRINLRPGREPPREQPLTPAERPASCRFRRRTAPGGPVVSRRRRCRARSACTSSRYRICWRSPPEKARCLLTYRLNRASPN